ncbi:dihydrolipoamide dehydrogenase [Humidesulfovibrio mexicanus]|uniref:Dihydrolipoamide dehydrogenase n=1 Tax=Humidesulfovibrio mexicanus TaxID=147047 RepID=A0A238Z146_9BACT|nr:FAD-dependent oxidoreductase [Humidesulfovibrio mexicanus]SNR77066.1 dihydrolipoamide dehydrogenase [Humidesulfovibrio mexicanus]
MTTQYDLVVLGGGPGGFDAAVEAAAAGLKTALVEAAELGGTCLNRGCIPTKLWLGATSAIEELAAQSKARVASGEVRVDFAALQAKKDRHVAATRKAMAARLAQLGVDLHAGRGRLADSASIEVAGTDGTRTIGFKNLLVATGSRPACFPGLTPDGVRVLDSTGFLALPAMPQSLIVVGGGFIGLEMAQAAHRLGAKITIVDALPRIAGPEDREVSRALEAAFRRMGWELRLGVQVTSVTTQGDSAVLTMQTSAESAGEELAAECALVAVGRRPNSADLGLESLGVELSGPGSVRTNEYLEAAPGVYAVGDVNGRTLLAHAASHQAHYVVQRLLGKGGKAPYDSGPVPSILYGNPEVLRVGLMADEAKAGGESVLVSRAQLIQNPIAQAHAATQGFVKCVWRQGRLVGVTAVGADVSRMAVSAALLVRAGWTREDAAGFMFPHPTLDESLKAAMLADKEAA